MISRLRERAEDQLELASKLLDLQLEAKGLSAQIEQLKSELITAQGIIRNSWRNTNG